MSNQIFPSQVRGLAFSVVKSQENSVMLKETPNFQSTRIAQNFNPRWHWRLEYSILFDNPLFPNPQLTYTDLQTMLGFIQARYTTYDDFLYIDPDDNSVGPGIITATWQPSYPYMLGTIILAGGDAQQVVSAPGGARSGLVAPTWNVAGGTTNDGGLIWQDLGASTAYPNPQAALQVVTDGTNYYSPIQRILGGQFYEDITDLNGPINVYQNGVHTTAALGVGGLNLPNFQSHGLYLSWGTNAPTQPVTATFNYYFRVRIEEPTQDFEKFVNQMWAMGGEENVQGKGYLKFMSAPPPTLLAGGLPPITIPPITPPVGSTAFITLYPTITSVNNPYYTSGDRTNSIAGPNASALSMLQTAGAINGFTGAGWSGYNLPPGFNYVIKGIFSIFIYVNGADIHLPAVLTSSASDNTGPAGGGINTNVTGTGLAIAVHSPSARINSIQQIMALNAHVAPSFNLHNASYVRIFLMVYY